MAKSFYRRTAGGQLVCKICDDPARLHQPDCPVIELQEELGDLTGQLLLFVTLLRETLDLFRDQEREDTGLDS